MSSIDVASALLAGAGAGLALGFAGAGGTIVGMPFFLYVAGMGTHRTIGTNALGVALTAIALLVIRARRGELRYAHGLLFALPGLAGLWLGIQLGMSVAGQRLVFLMGFLILIVAAYMYRLSRVADTTSTSMGPSRSTSGRVAARITPVALTVGAVSGFFGIGGGFMIVPGTSWAARLPIKAAAAASLIPIAAFASLVGIRYEAVGSASPALAAVMAPAGVAAGCAGIWLAGRVSVARFQQLFAGLLVILGLYMIFAR